MQGNTELRMKKYFILLFAILSTYSLYSQYYISGQDPASTRWRQINTENFQVIYPANFEQKAKHVTSMLEEVYKYGGKTLNHAPRKISVILHTQTVSSNGFVAWAPSRMELFTTPHQEIYAQDWLEQLVIHEFRHVVQIDKVWSELPFLLKAILGQQSAALTLGAYVPFWFLEGDAVVAETALSNTGRGRVPSFEMGLRAQVMEKGIYSYDKAYMGSFKDYIPNRYQLGYQLVAGAREKYGADLWGDVLSNVAKKPLSIVPFDKSLNKRTGGDKIGLYKEIFNDLKNKWQLQDESIAKTAFKTVSTKSKLFSDYRYPYYINDSTVFALKSAINDISRFVSITPKGQESVLFTPGDWFRESVSFSGNTIYWIERKHDIRWEHREFSLLRSYNINSGKLSKNRFRDKIYAPALSPDGKHIAAVKVSGNNRYTIAIISPETFDIITEISTQENYFIITPVWSENSDIIYAIAQGINGKALMEINPKTSESKILLPFSFNEIKRPVQKGNFIYYSNSQSGIDNIFALDLQSGTVYQITSSRFGASDVQLSSDGKKLVYCDYTSDGFRIVETERNRANWKKVTQPVTPKYNLAENISQQENNVIEFDTIDSPKYISKPYSKPLNLFNFHSWAPADINYNDNEINPGFSLQSQNKLSTAITQLGYRYSNTTETGKWYAKMQYLGFFPVLEFNTEFGKGKSHYFQITNYQNEQGEIVSSDTNKVSYTWNEFNVDFGVKIPLNLTHGKWFRLLQPEADIEFLKYWHDSSSPKEAFEGNIIPLSYRLYFHNILKRSQRDLQPQWGQILDLNYRHSLLGDIDMGNIVSAEGVLYTPGFLKHHGIKIYAGVQKKEKAETSFSDIILYPRGYNTILNNKLTTLRNDYILPLFYPDWNIGRWIYFRRFNLKLFYDYGWANAQVGNSDDTYYMKYRFSSMGTELTTDCNFLRFLAPALIGGRVIYMENLNDFRFEFIFSVNFSSL
jgi:hypothetical protein